ncbi:hypothetical protein B0H16DRAFT_1824079 [Mycena metata]|uniref:Uncharacterized protein n=1 Tax=Mycena metata TaxID=1033252 RepID=A0AAD7NFH3_9AGAR|nr:hypothetical protein B0H16DRAFT_1824079 [Mycena metata]
MNPNHNQTSSYYREHTRQQDGWTVLATPPANREDLPPPYTPAPAPVQVATASGNGEITLPFDIPINSNVIGATPVSRTKHYGRAVAFSIGYTEICHVMGLGATTAVLGYKWDNEKRNDPVHSLANAADWNNCLEKGIGMSKRARTRNVTCIIKNLSLPEETASGTKPIAGKKRKVDDTESSDNKKQFDFTTEWRTLKSHLGCATHKGQLCFVSPVDGHHHPVEPYEATLWAKEIAILFQCIGNASYTRPPANIVFQDFFLRKKRPRTTSTPAESSSTACAPTIHVTVNTGGGTSGSSSVAKSPPPRRPLGNITAATSSRDNSEKNIITIDDTPSSPFGSQAQIFDDSISDGIVYPPVTDILQLIDDSGKFVDDIPFPVVIFADDLVERHQISHVGHVPILNIDYYVNEVNMPLELAKVFVSESILALSRARKWEGARHLISELIEQRAVLYHIS